VDGWHKRMRHADSWRNLMNDRATRRASGSDIPPSIAGGGDSSSLLVDSAISHCEKLRRVLELQEWIKGTPDNPILATTCRKWKEEREQLLRELHLEQPDAADVGPATNSVASDQGRGRTFSLKKLMRLFSVAADSPTPTHR
jgi:hypothetical protein